MVSAPFLLLETWQMISVWLWFSHP
jgi:hypothetical protein